MCIAERSPNRGFAAASLLAALVVSAVVFAAGFSTYRFLLHYSSSLQQRLAAQAAVRKTLNIFGNELARTQVFEGIQNVSVDLDRSTITFRYINVHKALAATHQQQTSRHTAVQACGPCGAASGQSDWLAVSVLGTIHLRGRLRRQHFHNHGCISDCSYQGSLIPKPDPTFPNTLQSTAELSTPFLLLPIEEVFSLFVDRSTLRRRSHITRENQPVAAGLLALTLSRHEYSNRGTLYRATAAAQTADGANQYRETTYFRVKPYDRTALLNLLR